MITRIELHNFMSHRETVIEPSPGLTVLVGPNNCGKSALVAALQILCHNENSTYVKRHGARECAVVVHTSEGHVIEWRRKSSPRYLINGVEYGRLGNSGVPTELHELLRLPTVADEADNSFDVHFGSQKSPIFLLNSKAGTAAKFFASSSDASRLIEMQQRHRERISEARSDHKRLEAEAALNSAELAALEATVPLAERLGELEARHDALGQLEMALAALVRDTSNLGLRGTSVQFQAARTDALRRLETPPVLEDPETLNAHLARLAGLGSLVDRLTLESGRLAHLPSPPALHDLESLDSLLRAVAANTVRIEQVVHSKQTLSTLESPPPMADSIALEALVRQLNRSNRDAVSSVARCEQLRRLSPPPLLAPADELEARLSALQQRLDDVDRLRRAAAATAELTRLPAIPDVAPLATQLANMATAQERISEATRALQAVEQEFGTVQAALRDAVQGQSCPTCGQPFDADQLMVLTAAGLGGHAHD